MRIKTLWREPLLHFLLIGLALFVYYDLARVGVSEAPNRIVVSNGQVEQLASNFQRTWMRPPSETELAALIENQVREEVFYREAVAMGLDQNDSIVRRRMRMKLEFLLEDLSSVDVEDDELQAFLQRNADAFRLDARVSFEQVYLNPDRHEDLAAATEQLLDSLNNGANPDSLGDPMLVPRDYSLARQSEIARDFGEEFAASVVALAPGDWTGPIYSPFGAHILRISERIDARLPALVEIREQVKRDYLVQRRKEQKDLAYQKLREGYEVTIEPPSGGESIVSNAEAGETQ